MYNLKHFEMRAASPPLTLLSHAQSGMERRLGSRSARGCATELGLFLLPWHCRLAPSSICSFGTYSCNDYKQSLIKLQRTLPRNPCVSVYGDERMDCSSLFLSANVCVSHTIKLPAVVCICVVNWCISHQRLFVLFPLCHAQTAQSIHGLSVITKRSMTNYTTTLCSYYIIGRSMWMFLSRVEVLIF